MKKALLIIVFTLLIFQMVVLATAIDMGNAAIDRASSGGSYTFIDLANPSDGNGKLTSVEIWCATDLANCEVATFFNVSGSNYSTRDTHSIGAVTAGSKQTFSDLDIEVQSGDFIGIYFTAGSIEIRTSALTNLYYLAGDNIPCTNETFALWGTENGMSVYATGATVEVGTDALFWLNF